MTYTSPPIIAVKKTDQPTNWPIAFTVSLFDNQPKFSSKELTTSAYEHNSNLDGLGRCGVAIASCGKEIMPKEIGIDKSKFMRPYFNIIIYIVYYFFDVMSIFLKILKFILTKSKKYATNIQNI